MTARLTRFALILCLLANAAAAAAQATLAGFVTDSAKAPIAGAEVSLPDLKKATLTDDRGRFRIDSIPLGSQRVTVKHIGYSPVEAAIEFTTSQMIVRRFEMTRVVALDSVVVTAPNREVWREEFENQRKLGIGHFLTREDIAKIEGLHLSALLSTMPNVRLVQGARNYAFLTSKFALPGDFNVYYPEGFERNQGAKIACYSRVYIDNMLMNKEFLMSSPPAPRPGLRATPPFDINSINPSSVESIEYYAGQTQVPFRYSSAYANCGVMVIHTRR